MPCIDYPQSYDSTDNGLPQQQQSSREWVLEWNRKSDTSEVKELLQQIQRSRSSTQPETNSDSPSGSFARSNSVPRNADEQMESAPFEMKDLSCSPGAKFGGLRQTIGEVTSEEDIAGDARGNERVFVSSFCIKMLVC